MNSNDESQLSHQPADADNAKSEAVSSPGFRLGNVLKIVVPAAILAVGVWATTRFMDVDALIEKFTAPSLAPATGQVLYDGQPLADAQVMTHPSSGRGALGWTNDQGKFTLKTDVQGQLVDGAAVGEHRVVVTAYKTISAAAAPPLLTPQKYASPATTPITIAVQRNEKNHFSFDLKAEKPKQVAAGEASEDTQEPDIQKRRDR